MAKPKNISFVVEEEFHKQIKLKATNEGLAIKEYIINLIKADLEKENQENEQENQEN